MSSTTSTSSFQVLYGKWPTPQETNAILDLIIKAIATDKTSLSLTNNIGYLTLGYFFINVDLIHPHLSQRQIISDHARKLKEDFETQGILRYEHPGVVIGLEEGWKLRKNNRTVLNQITKTLSFLDHLSQTAGGPISKVIQGGH